MTKLKFILLKLFLWASPFIVSGQVSFLPISADYSVFQMNDSLAYVEFYVSFFQSNLQYNYKNDTLNAAFETNLLLKQAGKDYKKVTHSLKNTITDSTQIDKYGQFFDIFKIALPFRYFSATIQVTDKISGFSGEYVLDINIPGFSKEFYISDIQLSSNIKRTDKSGKYVKNNLTITPHPRKTYDLLQPMLYYYVELNNLSYSDSDENKYEINYFVTNEHDDTTKTGVLKSKVIAGKAQVEMGAFNALSLPSGVYYLNIHTKDVLSGVTSNSRKRFLVQKPTSKKSKNQQLSETDPVLNLITIEDLKLEFDGARYFASKQEKKIFDQLVDVKEIRVFLTSFWRNQDKNNGIAYGLSRARFLKLLNIANSQYGSSMAKGYKTDRGRVLIQYGTPNEIERFPYKFDTKPYEIWKYHKLEGGKDFIFADRNGFGDYDLLHSTYYKEVQYPDWYSLILIAPNPPRDELGDDKIR